MSIETCFMAPYMIYLSKCSSCIWNEYISGFVWGNVLQMSIGSSWLIVIVKSSPFLPIFWFKYSISVWKGGGSVGKKSSGNAGDPDSSPGRNIPRRRKMAIHSSILAWEIPWQAPVHGVTRVGHDLATKLPPLKPQAVIVDFSVSPCSYWLTSVIWSSIIRYINV